MDEFLGHCNGLGRCLTMSQLARRSKVNGVRLDVNYTSAWDAGKMTVGALSFEPLRIRVSSCSFLPYAGLGHSIPFSHASLAATLHANSHGLMRNVSGMPLPPRAYGDE